MQIQRIHPAVLRWSMIGAAGLFAGSFAGVLHGLGDSLAVFRWHLAGLVIAIAVAMKLSGHRHALWLGVLALVAILPSVWATVRPQSPVAPDLVHYQKNLKFNLQNIAPLVTDIRVTDPDILTLQEVSQRNRHILKVLQDDLPTQMVCRAGRSGAVALASRFPAIPGTEFCHNSGNLAAMQVEGPAGPLWIVSIHLPWPWPFSQSEQLYWLGRALSGMEGDKLIGGDFNMVPWGYSVRRLQALAGAQRVGRALISFPRLQPILPLPIDHIFAPPGARAATQLRETLGSDHRGLVALVDLAE